MTTKRARKKLAKDALIIERMNPLMDAITPHVIRSERGDLSFIKSEESKKNTQIVLGHMNLCLKAFFELHTAYTNSQLTLRVARQYPWRNRTLTRSEHLNFAWFQFVNLCYLFEEKYKLSANEYNKIMKMFRRSNREDIRKGTKRIEQTLGSFVKTRGMHFHEWYAHNDHVQYLGLTEFLHKHGKGDRTFADVKIEYQLARLFLGHDIKAAVEFMEDFLLDVIDGYMEEFRKLTIDFNEIVEKFRTEDVRIRLVPTKAT